MALSSFRLVTSSRKGDEEIMISKSLISKSRKAMYQGIILNEYGAKLLVRILFQWKIKYT